MKPLADSHPLLVGGRVPSGCLVCGQVHLVQSARLGGPCPVCATGTLEAQSVRDAPEPEAMVPFGVQRDEAGKRLAAWAREARLPPRELTGETLAGRLEASWWPMWLVDATLVGTWQAETGEDYEVKSSRETFDGRAWHSQEVMETRIQWEPAAGAFLRRVDNVLVPAVHAWEGVEKALGAWAVDDAGPPPTVIEGVVRLPDLDTDAAFPGAEVGFKHRAAGVCHEATGATHLRSFTLVARYEDLHWTLLLVPMWTAWYTDDDGERWPVHLHGTTGRIAGAQLRSVSKGRVRAAIWATVGVVLFVVGLVASLIAIVFPVAWLLTVPLMLVGIAPLLGALVPLFGPARHNRAERARWGRPAR